MLVRHFFGRFFDKEALSPQGDPGAGVIQTLGVLAVPGAFFFFLFRPLAIWGWSLVSVRCLFLMYSMVVMGFILVFQWDALFPDRRDYQILAPMPIRLRTLFLAKIAALLLFLAIFLVDINAVSFLLWPGIDGGSNSFDIWWAHLVVMLAGGLFGAMSMAAVQGLLVTVFNGRSLRRAAVAVQTLAMTALVMTFFLIPLIGFGTEDLVRRDSAILQWFPGYWFLGLYERLRPVTGNPLLLSLGERAIYALISVTAVFVLTYLPGYRRLMRRVVEAPEPPPAGPAPWRLRLDRLLRTTILRHPVELAVFRFITQSLTRSTKHRMFLATYGDFGAAVAVMSFGAGSFGLLTLPLTLSFVMISGLRAAFNFPSELNANWTFQIGELFAPAHYLSATRKWVIWSAIVPLFAVLSVMEFICFPWPDAAFHLAFGLLLSLLLTEVMFAGFRKVPFTCSHFPGKVNLVLLCVLYIFGFTLYSRWMARLEVWLFDRPLPATLFFVIGVCLLLAATRWRAVASSLDFDDPVDPVVRTLGLNPE